MKIYKTYTDQDFDLDSFHDCPIHSFLTSFSEVDWHSQLILFIDYITEWIVNPEKELNFMLSPATLVFHNVTNLSYDLRAYFESYQNVVENQPIELLIKTQQSKGEQLVNLNRNYCIWEIIGGHSKGFNMKFGATGFSLFLHEPPVVSRTQNLEVSILNRTRYYFDDLRT